MLWIHSSFHPDADADHYERTNSPLRSIYQFYFLLLFCVFQCTEGEPVVLVQVRKIEADSLPLSHFVLFKTLSFSMKTAQLAKCKCNKMQRREGICMTINIEMQQLLLIGADEKEVGE